MADDTSPPPPTTTGVESTITQIVYDWMDEGSPPEVLIARLVRAVES